MLQLSAKIIKFRPKTSRSACSFCLSATSQQYFSLRTNQPPATSQQYFSLTTNQHQPLVTSQTNRLDIAARPHLLGLTPQPNPTVQSAKIGAIHYPLNASYYIYGINKLSLW
jgi:hypothetical protein